MDTKKCRRCSEKIKKDAKICKHCKSDIRLWHKRHPILTVIALIFIAILMFDALANTAAPITSEDGGAALEVQNSVVGTKGSYNYISGEIKNISNKTLEDIVAEGVFYDENGRQLATGEAMVDYSPLLPGETSPFQVVAGYNPSISSGAVYFTNLWGTRILDDRMNK